MFLCRHPIYFRVTDDGVSYLVGPIIILCNNRRKRELTFKIKTQALKDADSSSAQTILWDLLRFCGTAGGHFRYLATPQNAYLPGFAQ